MSNKMSDSKWGIPHSSMSWDTPYGYYNPCETGHDWALTGMRRTWCKRCDCDGELDPLTGAVSIVFRAKNKETEQHRRGED